jgi:hypothetical protein
MSARIARAALVLAGLAGLAAGPAAAQPTPFEGKITMRLSDPGEGGAREVQYLVRKGMARMEMQASAHRAVMIFDPSKNVTYMVMPDEKIYMEMQMPQVAVTKADAQKPEITRTGRKETVAGHECEHWIIKEPTGDVDACVATGLGTFMMGRNPMQRGGPEPAWRGSLRDGQGFPLKVAKVGGATMLEVTKIEQVALDAALFAPPAGFQKMAMPPMMGQPRRP